MNRPNPERTCDTRLSELKPGRAATELRASIWSARSLLPLLNAQSGRKAAAICAHSKRFATSAARKLVRSLRVVSAVEIPRFRNPAVAQAPPLRPAPSLPLRLREPRFGFTLLEVTIAMALFFMATFAILGLVSNTLRNARQLQETEVDASMLASELSATNKLYEATDSGDFGDAYRDYSWTRDIHQVGTNGLFEVDFVVHHRLGRSKHADTSMSVLFFRPLSPTDRFGPTLR